MRLLKYSSIAILLPTLLALLAAVAASSSPGRMESASITVPESTDIHVTLNDTVASNRSKPGDHFEATVSEPIVIDGMTVIPKGAQATGVVVDALPSGRIRGRAHLQLALESLSVDGQSYDIRTASEARIAGQHRNRKLALIGGGVGGGLLIGALAGGGEGALIGGPLGAGAGTAAVLLTGRKDVRLGPETPLTFRLANPVTINLKG